MTATLNVHLDCPPKPADLEFLREQLLPGIRVAVGPELPGPAAYEVLVAGRPDRDQITASPALRALIVPWAGIPDKTRELMLDYPSIAVHNLHHNAVPVAELAVALLLAAAKSVIRLDRALRRDDWTPRYEGKCSLLVAGRTALVLGYGAVGREVARLCRALGMHVVAVRRHIPPGSAEGPDEVHPAADLDALLPRADALFICLPHTPATDGLIGERQLALLPAGALLVNMGRGPIVDEGALFRALQEGRLFGAGLDVWYNYPADPQARPHTPPATHPFGELENVVMSPHRGGQSDRTERLRMEHLAQLLNAAREGRPIPNRVDLAAGY
jgi:phosphoglycerate dehydrogenase-like enzyme